MLIGATARSWTFEEASPIWVQPVCRFSEALLRRLERGYLVPVAVGGVHEVGACVHVDVADLGGPGVDGDCQPGGVAAVGSEEGEDDPAGGSLEDVGVCERVAFSPRRGDLVRLERLR